MVPKGCLHPPEGPSRAQALVIFPFCQGGMAIRHKRIKVLDMKVESF